MGNESHCVVWMTIIENWLITHYKPIIIHSNLYDLYDLYVK